MPELPNELRRALGSALGERRWDHHGAEMNAVWIDRDREVVVRVAPPDTELVSVEQTVRAAHLLRASGVPAVRLHPSFDNAVGFEGGQATVWSYVEDDGLAVDVMMLAKTLRVLHAVPPPSDLPVRDVRPRVERRLGHLRESQSGRSAYWDLLDDWYRRTAASYDRFGQCVVHGDIRPVNVISAGGEAVLLDLDSVSSGPAVLDVWAVLVDKWSGRLSVNDYRTFSQALGQDPDGSDVPDLVRLVNLAYTTLEEVRSADSRDPDAARRRSRFERWWMEGASLDQVGGWKFPWT